MSIRERLESRIGTLTEAEASEVMDYIEIMLSEQKRTGASERIGQEVSRMLAEVLKTAASRANISRH
jgi:hypothetical protein